MSSEGVRREFASEQDKRATSLHSQFPDDGCGVEAYIEKRIEEARRRKASRKFEYCPACKGGVGTRQKFMLHLRKCCKDLLADRKVPVVFSLLSGSETKEGRHVDDPEKFSEFLRSLTEKETELKSRALFLRYLDPSRTKRRTIEEVADAMGLPVDRTERLIKTASKEVPLAKDEVPIDVLYEDEWIVAVQKPPYIITSPKHRFLGGTLFSRVFGYLDTEPFGLHRLDMNTSGVVVFAKDAVSAEAVNVQFREKSVKKAYLAICLGMPKESEFVSETYIDSDPSHEVARQVSDSDGKWSKTSFRVLDSHADVHLMDSHNGTGSNFSPPIDSKGACLLLCTPLTGRTHQIRLHSAHEGHSIIGDDIYGVLGPWIARQALHAFCIEFRHPSSGEEITITAPPPEDFSHALTSLGLKIPNTVMPPR